MLIYIKLLTLPTQIIAIFVKYVAISVLQLLEFDDNISMNQGKTIQFD